MKSSSSSSSFARLPSRLAGGWCYVPNWGWILARVWTVEPVYPTREGRIGGTYGSSLVGGLARFEQGMRQYA